ncbi:MAG: hypothetical protein Q4D71_07805, partial [Oscillospiraceae bacterium]|nr:hypothetical protein [Oscillospiraceae bacterium]
MEKKPAKHISAAFLMLAVIYIVLSSVPLFSHGLANGHDIGYHLYRVVSVSNAVEKGTFPVRIYEERFNYYGYGSPLYYCDFFLYVPALFHNLFHLDYTFCWKIFIFIINILTFVFSYYGFRAISSAEIGLLASLLYSLSTYRLVDVYTRAAIGETCALMFLPLILCGFVQIKRGYYRYWPVLAAGYAGVLLSHMLSFLMMLLFGAAFCIIHWHEIIKKESILSILKAVLLALGCTAWFLVPLISAIALPVQATQNYPDFYLTTLSLSDLFDFRLLGAASMETYKGILPTSSGYGITKTPGTLLVFGSFLFLAAFLINKRKKDSPLPCFGLFVSGWIIILLMSDLFPWKQLQDLPVFTVIRSFQFVWRFNMLVILFFSVCTAYSISYFIKKQTVSLPVITVLLLVFSFIFYTTYLPQSRRYTDDNMPLLTDELYLFVDNDMTTRQLYESNWDSLIVNPLPTKHGVTFEYSVRLSSTSLPLYIDVPLNYYPGYVATVDGDSAKVTYSPTGIVRVYIPDNKTEGLVSV